MDRRCGRTTPYPVWGHAMRTDSGRPNSSMRLSAWTATSTSVARRSSVRERNPSPNHAFEPAHGGLDPGTDIVTRCLLPSHAAFFGDELQVAVTLCGRGLGRVAGHRRRARGRDDGRLGMALGDAGVDAFLVVRTVAGERGDLAVHLVQQGTDLGAIIDVVGGQRGRDDLAGVGIPAEVELPPGSARLRAVLLDQPLARPAQL